MSGYAKSKGFVTRGVAQFAAAAQVAFTGPASLEMFATQMFNDSTGIVKTSNTQVTLKAGKKYRITCSCNAEAFGDATIGFVEFQLHIDGVSKCVYQAASMMVTNASINFQRSGPLQYIHSSGADAVLTIRGQSLNGSATVNSGSPTVIIEEVEAYAALTPASTGMEIAGATAKTAPIDADSVGISDSADGGILKKLTWANLKATLLNTAMTWVGKQTFDGGAAIKGATSVVAAGYVGEVIEASYSDVSSGSNDVAVNITSLTLSAGVWTIYAQTGQSPSTTSLVVSDVSISLTSATLDAKYLTRLRGSAGAFDVYFSTFVLSPRYMVASTTTTVYLVGRNTYTGSAPGVWNNLLTKFYAVREV